MRPAKRDAGIWSHYGLSWDVIVGGHEVDIVERIPPLEMPRHRQ